MSDHKNRSKLDDAIDRALADMMHSDARPGFRGRVLAQLRSQAPRTAWLSAPALAAASFAIVAVIVALTLGSRSHEPATAPGTIAEAHPPAPSLAATPRAEAPAAASKSAPRPRRTTAEAIFGPKTGRVAATSHEPIAQSRDAPLAAREWMPVSAGPPAIVIEPITIPDQIVVKPIDVPWLNK